MYVLSIIFQVSSTQVFRLQACQLTSSYLDKCLIDQGFLKLEKRAIWKLSGS